MFKHLFACVCGGERANGFTSPSGKKRGKKRKERKERKEKRDPRLADDLD